MLFSEVCHWFTEWLRPLARASSNRALFTPQTDPTLIRSENAMADNNRMYVMKVCAVYAMNMEISLFS